jgi:hypothetical protein
MQNLNIRIHRDITGEMGLVVGVKILDSKFKGDTNNGGRSQATTRTWLMLLLIFNIISIVPEQTVSLRYLSENLSTVLIHL